MSAADAGTKYTVEQQHASHATVEPAQPEADDTDATTISDIDAIPVRRHAVFRYLSRQDATEPFPKSRIRQLFQRAQRVEHGPNGSRWDAQTGLVFILGEGGGIQTCYYRPRDAVQRRE